MRMLETIAGQFRAAHALVRWFYREQWALYPSYAASMDRVRLWVGADIPELSRARTLTMADNLIVARLNREIDPPANLVMAHDFIGAVMQPNAPLGPALAYHTFLEKHPSARLAGPVVS